VAKPQGYSILLLLRRSILVLRPCWATFIARQVDTTVGSGHGR